MPLRGRAHRLGRGGCTKRTGTGAAVGGGAGTGAGIYTSSGGSAETSQMPAASNCAIVLGDQPINATGMVAGAGAGMGAGTGAGTATAGQLVLGHVHEAPFLLIFYLLWLGVDFTKLEY